jgi:glycine/D-amino acid oxidase-like deaminating enzyme
MRSYAIAVRAAAPAPAGMFISADQPTRSIRAHPLDRGEVIIVGGEGHLAGEEGETTPERYQRLASFARERFGAADVTHRWSAHDLKSADGLPYVGRLTPLSRHVWVGCGYRKWGMTNGTAAGLILADLIRGVPTPYAGLLDPQRLTPLASARGLAEETLKDARHFVRDRLHGSRYSVDGEVLHGPAVRPLERVDAGARPPD